MYFKTPALDALEGRADDPDRLAGLVERLSACVAAGPLSTDQADAALADLTDAAEPVEALSKLVQLCESDRARPILAGEPAAVGIFVTLAAQGEYPARSLQRHPRDLTYLADMMSQPGPRPVGSLTDELTSRIDHAVASGEDRRDAVYVELRRLKRRESLRIYLDEVKQTRSVRQTAAEIGRLAEVCLTVACQQGAQTLQTDRLPALSDHLCVLGMGKLGGRELNFSSDVDLVYVSSDVAAADAGLKSRLDTLARWVTQAIEKVTADGYVFRVDLRLRPEGNKGSLVHSVGAAVDYYLNWGRTWERSALIKARPVAGNHQIADDLLEGIDPFLYRRYLDFDVLDDLRAMKEQIDQNAQVAAAVGLDDADVDQPGADVAGGHRREPSGPDSPFQQRLRRKMNVSRSPQSRRRGLRAGRPRGRRSPSNAERSAGNAHGAGADGDDGQRPERPDSPPASQSTPATTPRQDQTGSLYGWDVKIGVGGIREIEFFVQALQLIHCGTRPALRVRRTLDALDRLLYAGLITHDDHAVLADAYDLFRRVEHRIQMEHDRQSHRLPADRAGFVKLARRMGGGADELRDQLTRRRGAIAAIFERLFASSAQVSEEPTVRESQPAELDTVLAVYDQQLFAPPVLEALEALGFRRPSQVAGQLQVLRDKSYGPYAERAGTRQSKLSRYILQACATAADPDQAFSYWSRLSTVVGDRPGFYGMLFEHPHATRLLLHVFGSSDYLAAIVMREPNVIDYLLGAGTVAVVRRRSDMQRELARRLDGIADPSHRLGRLRRFQQEEILRIALHEVAGACDIDETVEQLSMLAEVAIDAVLEEVYADMSCRLDADDACIPPADELPFVVLGVGKLGGRELTFGSDLDVLFVYEPIDEIGLDHVFYARLAQRLVRNLTSVSDHGKLYDVDTRLRPSGRQGTLVVSLEAFCHYHRGQADLWERQAMIRARPLTGSTKLRAAILDLRSQMSFDQPTPDDMVRSFRSMRDRMVQHLGAGGPNMDIKSHPGGMIDVEFLTQYLQLVYAGRFGGPSMSDEQARGDEVIDGSRSQNTVRALTWLADAPQFGRLEPAVDCQQLLDDYRTLRRIEARLRTRDQRASNRLPTAPDQLQILARRLGYQGPAAREQFVGDLKALTARVAAQFDAVITASH